MPKSKNYEEFVEKFKPKKTTDDCYTPDAVYDIVLDYVRQRYGIAGEVVRPFYPGRDYINYPYPDGCIVVDNPPFSILKQIVDFYCDQGIQFFLFAPQLTIFSCLRGREDALCVLPVAANVVYANGAMVSTGFVTNLETNYIAISAPDLRKRLTRVVKKDALPTKPKYKYPRNVLTSSVFEKLAKCGADIAIKRTRAKLVRCLSDQQKMKKTIFGSGLLIADREAEEVHMCIMRREKEDVNVIEWKRREEEREAIEWKLSEKEREVIEQLGEGV